MKEETNEKLFYPKCHIPCVENDFRFLINISGFYKTNAISSIQFQPLSLRIKLDYIGLK
jgi:hypothetical protein